MMSTAFSEADAALFKQQARAIDACFDQHIPAGKPVALLQFPFDHNAGNHMMWVATCDYLAQRGAPIAYAAHNDNLDIAAMKGAIGDGAVLFIGGVTVSRLWPSHAQVKRAVASACPGNRLISLPSTMLFIDDEDRRGASTVFGDHRDVVMMARDPVSAAAAREVFPDTVSVVTVHDAAFRLPPQPRRAHPDHEILWLARDDLEGVGFKPPADVHVFDWPHDYARFSRRLLISRAFSKLRKIAPALSPLANLQISAGYARVSRQILQMGNRMLDMGKVLVTDRMHPHVLGALRGQHSVLLPDRFGKNRAVYEYSSRDYSTVHWADTPEQALDLARALVRT